MISYCLCSLLEYTGWIISVKLEIFIFMKWHLVKILKYNIVSTLSQILSFRWVKTANIRIHKLTLTYVASPKIACATTKTCFRIFINSVNTSGNMSGRPNHRRVWLYVYYRKSNISEYIDSTYARRFNHCNT